MELNLEKVDEVRERTGVSYKEAKEALEISNGDVLEAVIYIEAKQQKGFTNNMSEKGNEIIQKLKELIKKGNVTRILLRRDSETVMNIPITAGAIGAVLFTPATIAGILVALATGCKLEIVKDDGQVIDIRDITEDTFNNVKTKVDEAKEKFSENNKNDKDSF
jgi:NACalpha-BTF3-like transcription factor